MTEQLEFDFSHKGYRRSLIQAYRCTEVTFERNGEVRHVAAKDLKHILRVIDDFGRTCYASYQSIARSADCSVSHVRRCVRGLVELGVLAERRRAHGIEYSIVFSELAIATGDRVSVPPGAVSIANSGPPHADRPASQNPSGGCDCSSDCSSDCSRDCSRDCSTWNNKPPNQITKEEEEGAPPHLEIRGQAPLESDPPPEFGRLVEEYARAGVYDPVGRLRSALAAGVTLAHLMAILRHYRGRDELGPGALCLRLQRASPHLPVAAGWPVDRRSTVETAVVGQASGRQSARYGHRNRAPTGAVAAALAEMAAGSRTAAITQIIGNVRRAQRSPQNTNRRESDESYKARKYMVHR